MEALSEIRNSSSLTEGGIFFDLSIFYFFIFFYSSSRRQMERRTIHSLSKNCSKRAHTQAHSQTNLGILSG